MKKFIVIFLFASFIANLAIGMPLILHLKGQVKALSMESYTSPIATDPVVILTNYERQKAGIKPLKQNDKLMLSAQAKACDMVILNYWSHFGPDGTNSQKFFRRVKYYYKHAGENLCRNSDDSGCITLWLESPAHKELMLNPIYEDVGIGRCGIYIVEHFGSLK